MQNLTKILNDINKIIASRKDADVNISYTAGLFAEGRKKIAQKVGEEGVEVALAGVLNNKNEIINESADLLFHLLILWQDSGITADEVAAEISRRENISGLDEKKNRK